MSNNSIMVVEDDNDLSEALCDTLKLAGYEVTLAENGDDALSLLKENIVDLVVSDVHMEKMDGFSLLKKVQKDFPQLPVMMMTAYGTIQKAVEAMQMGAVDYLVKPFEAEVLVNMVGQYIDSYEIHNEEMVIESSAMKQLILVAKKVAKGNVAIMITGESGTGKELLARFIHQQSSRKEGPFIAINCAAIPENMLEATLFGYEKGAFTGAYKACPGKFEQAQGGTFLLDEISEMDLALQAKLLRVLQEQEVERLGGTKTIKLDVRILSTSNQNMKQYVKQGRFREDLYYRLNVFPLKIANLNDRQDDILPIADKLVHKHALKLEMAIPVLSEKARSKIQKFYWKGNIRELENVIQRSLLLCTGNVILEDNILLDIDNECEFTLLPEQQESCKTNNQTSLGKNLKSRELDIILETLTKENGSRKATALRLGISERTLRYKLAKIRESGLMIPGDKEF